MPHSRLKSKGRCKRIQSEECTLILIFSLLSLFYPAGETQAAVPPMRGTAVEAGAELLVPGPDDTISHYAIVRLGPFPATKHLEFSAFVLPSGEEPAGKYRVKAVFPKFTGNYCLLHLRGWPRGISGEVDILVQVERDGQTVPFRIEGALTIATQPIDVALLIDDSYSMRRTDPEKLRVTAAKMFASIAAARDDVSTITVISFTYRAKVLLPPTPPGEGKALERALDGLKAEGRTDMDVAFSLASKVLQPLRDTRKIAIVLSDGRDAPGRYAGGHRIFAAREWPVYTIGLSAEADVETLKRISGETGGDFFFAPTADELGDIFRKIALSIHRSVVITDWRIGPGARREIPVDDSIRLLTFVLGRGTSATSVSITSPDGSIIRLMGPDPENAFAEILAPARGRWLAEGSGEAGEVLSVTASSELELVPYPVTEEVVYGKPVEIACLLTRGSEAVTGAHLIVSVTGPEGRTDIELLDDGRHGDNRAGDGVYGGVLVPGTGSGTYRCRLVAVGRTDAGFDFERTSGFNFEVAPPPVPVLPVGPEVASVAEPVAEEPLPALSALPALSGVEGSGVDLSDVALAKSEASRPPKLQRRRLAEPEGPNWIRLAIILLLLAIILALFIRWLLRCRYTAPYMAKYILVSVLAHILIFFLTMDLLIETGVVELEEISPTIAVKIRAIEESLGFEITPAGKKIALAESESELAVSRKTAESRTDSKKPLYRPDSAAGESVLEARRIEDLPKMAREDPESAKRTIEQTRIMSEELTVEQAEVKEKTEVEVPEHRLELKRASIASVESARTSVQPETARPMKSAPRRAAGPVQRTAMVEDISERPKRVSKPEGHRGRTGVAPAIVSKRGAGPKAAVPVKAVRVKVKSAREILDQLRPAGREEARAVRVAGAGVRTDDRRVRVESPFAEPKNARLETARTELKPGAQRDALKPRVSFSIRAAGKGKRKSVPVSLAKYSDGDWDCSPTAMMYLAHQIEERTGMALETSERVVNLAGPELMKVPFVYMTGHKDFVFTPMEVRNLRKYLKGGGNLWVDDSTHFSDNTFDTAFRREIARLLPEKELVKLDKDFPGFTTGYDFSGGYKGYAIPPGDKYRLDYIEGIHIDDRVAVVYTRNDYGDGLNIDPDTYPLRPSLTDLSPAEMQEGSVRMGINLILYFLTGGTRTETDFLERTGAVLREAEDVAAPAFAEGKARVLDWLDTAEGWTIEQWGDAGVLSTTDRKLQIEFSLGDKKKVAFSRTFEGRARLLASDVLVIDVESRLRSGSRLAVGIFAGGRYFETQPFYLKPGRNTAFFRMSAGTFKTRETDWEFRASLGAPVTVDRFTLLIYSPAPGRIILDNLRVVKGMGDGVP